MKSCPKCNRTFPDEGQKFCTFDGGLLIGPQAFDPNTTIRADARDLTPASEKPTSRDLPDPGVTIAESYASTITLPRNTAPTTAPNTGDFAQSGSVTPPPEQTPPPVVPQPPAAFQSQGPSAPLPPVKKRSKLPWIIVGILVVLLLGGGAIAGVFFVVIKPRLDQFSAKREVSETPPVVQPTTNAETPKPVEEPSVAPTDNYVPPPGTVEFVNSNANLDGTLAEHYFDFSFYYPESWHKDPNAGVPGATNFAKVDRRLPPDFTQENFAVGWYTSTGTYTGDLPSFPRRVQELSAVLSKSIPQYRKVSEGPTTVNSMKAYEFRWVGFSKGTEKGDLELWGRVVFLPTGNEGDTTGATLTLLSTSLAPELSSVEDVGTKGEAPVTLESFRFGKKK
jgi:hypothetical protein